MPARSPAVRRMLRDSEDGLTAPYIARVLNAQPSDVRRTLKAMPDVYIDRWLTPKRGQVTAVYMAVEVPDDCPKPRRKT